MHYCEKGVRRLITGVPVWLFSSERQLSHLLTSTVETGEELKHLLFQYPQVRYEALDFHYVCLQSLAVPGPELIADLLSGESWTEVQWGAFLACLTRDIHYGPYLRAVAGRTTKRSAVVELATRICSGTLTNDDNPNLLLLSKLYRQLAKCPRLPVVLSLSKPAEHQRLLQANVRVAYRKSGADAALAVIRNIKS